MAYKRKTRDRWDIETKWDGQWDIECSEYTWKEAKATYNDYKNNWHGEEGLRLTKHREKIEEVVA